MDLRISFLETSQIGKMEVTINFKKHDNSLFHKGAYEQLFTLPATTRNVGELLSFSYSLEKAEKLALLAQNSHCPQIPIQDVASGDLEMKVMEILINY